MLARENPFRTEVVVSYRYQFAHGDSMDALADRFRRQNFRGAIVGPKGRGKTTLSEDLCTRLGESGESVSVLQLNQQHKSQAMKLCEALVAKAPAETILVIDGAEQLGWLQWHRFLRQTQQFRGLLVTVHRGGRLPELIRCETSVRLLEDLVRAIAPAEFDEIGERLPSLYHQHHGNLRECLRSLYDHFASR